MLFQRNIYKKLLDWKNRSAGETALLLEGARRVGKSTIVEEFAKKEYRSYILINFGDTKGSFTKDVKAAFEKSQSYDEFFTMLQLVTGIKLYPGESLIIFDEVQKYIKAREMIKFLVKDGRFHFIETGSLISIKKNSRKIVIPSEEETLEMYPMTFDEFLTAAGEEMLVGNIQDSYKELQPLMQPVHQKAYRLFRTYMAIGGMPQAVSSFLETSDFEKADMIKKEIIKLYREDLDKISRKASSVTPRIIYDNIQSAYSNHSFEVSGSNFSKNTKLYTRLNNIEELEKSKVVNVAYDIRNIDASLSLGYDLSGVKVYSGDTGLLISKIYYDRKFVENGIYKSLILDKVSADEGFLYENVVAQMLRASGHELKYNTFYTKGSKSVYSTDFLITDGKKINPIEVKSSSYKTHASIDAFSQKYHQYIGKKYVIYGKNLIKENELIYLPVYMTWCL